MKDFQEFNAKFIKNPDFIAKLVKEISSDKFGVPEMTALFCKILEAYHNWLNEN